MTNLIQSLGIVFSIVLLIVISLATLYISYIVAIGVLLVGAVYITYNLVSTVKQLSPKLD